MFRRAREDVVHGRSATQCPLARAADARRAAHARPVRSLHTPRPGRSLDTRRPLSHARHHRAPQACALERVVSRGDGRRRRTTPGGAPASAERQLLLPLADEDPLGPRGRRRPGCARAGGRSRGAHWLASIVEAARLAARAESKAARLVRILGRISEPVIVFTEYRDTLDRLAAATWRGRTARRDDAWRDGGGERERVQRSFNRGGQGLARDRRRFRRPQPAPQLPDRRSLRAAVASGPYRAARRAHRPARSGAPRSRDRTGRRRHRRAPGPRTADREGRAGTGQRRTGRRPVGFAQRGRGAGARHGQRAAGPPATVTATAATRALDLGDEAAVEFPGSNCRGIPGALSSRRVVAPAGVDRPLPASPPHNSYGAWGLGRCSRFSLTDGDGRSVHSEVVTLSLDGLPPGGHGVRALRDLCHSLRRWSGEPGIECMTR